jgi:hypothetical protein
MGNSGKSVSRRPSSSLWNWQVLCADHRCNFGQAGRGAGACELHGAGESGAGLLWRSKCCQPALDLLLLTF